MTISPYYRIVSNFNFIWIEKASHMDEAFFSYLYSYGVY
ncbi:hypothetical protein MPQ_0114 [Methylovorus sp. MP688]|nr:hypothetical protein MPQ_0114 [Methylovorus sp. MP688]